MKKLALLATIIGMTAMLAACSSSKQSMCEAMTDKIMERAKKAMGGNAPAMTQLKAARSLAVAKCMKLPDDQVKTAYERLQKMK